MVRCLFLLACIFLCSALGEKGDSSTLQYAPYRYQEKTDLEPHPVETVFNKHGFYYNQVMERNLVTEDVDQGSILDEYNRYSSQTTVKHTKEMPILGFVTPWNKRNF